MAVGCGWQAFVAYVNVGCYYVVGVPLGCLLGFKFDLGAKVRIGMYSLLENKAMRINYLCLCEVFLNCYLCPIKRVMTYFICYYLNDLEIKIDICVKLAIGTSSVDINNYVYNSNFS